MKYYIRKATLSDAEGIAKVHVDSWKTTYPGLIPDAIIRANTYQKRVESWRSKLENWELDRKSRTSQTYVAISDHNFSDDIKAGQIIGFIFGGKICVCFRIIF